MRAGLALTPCAPASNQRDLSNLIPILGLRAPKVV